MPAAGKPNVLAVVAALLLGGVYFGEVQWEHGRASCSRAQARTFVQVLTARAGPSTARQDAEDALLDGMSVLVLHPPQTARDKASVTKAYQALFSDYYNAAATYRETKVTSPLPVFPSC